MSRHVLWALDALLDAGKAFLDVVNGAHDVLSLTETRRVGQGLELSSHDFESLHQVGEAGSGGGGHSCD